MQNEEGAVAAQQRRPISFERLDGFTDGLIAVSADLRLAELFPGRFYQMATKHFTHGRADLPVGQDARQCADRVDGLSRRRVSGDSLRACPATG